LTDTVHLETLGCKLNQIETESLAAAFTDAGFGVDRAEDVSSDSLYLPVGIVETSRFSRRILPILSVVNTCTVTGKAEQKARRLIRLLLSKYPDAPVLVTGCYAEVEQAAIEAIDSRVVAFPGRRKGELAALPSWLSSRTLVHPEEPLLLALRAFCARDASGDSGAFALSTDNFLFHSRASIKIQDGCDNRCAYCRIRLARGKAVSLEPGEVVSRIRAIEEAGWNEVVLAGVNLTQYRFPAGAVDGARASDDNARGGSSRGDFAELLRMILADTDRIAIRISSLYPERIDDAILPYLANSRVRPHFHLSVQSGSDRVLSLMRRPYGAETVRAAAKRLRSIRENPFLACDIIAGFPGETDDDFELTLDLCRDVGFAWIHAFPFSPRPGTEAATMRPKVPERVAGERVRILTDLAAANLRSYRDYWTGRDVEAIAERAPDGNPVTAMTENYLSVVLPPGTARAGERLNVRIGENGSAAVSCL
jgi:threonylcarbamoyladenosine tRNA methylthiotransferase MtaB